MWVCARRRDQPSTPRARAQEGPNARFLAWNDGRASLGRDLFFMERPSGFSIPRLASSPFRFLDSPLNQFLILFELVCASIVEALCDPCRVAWNARLALNGFALRLAEPSAIRFSIRSCDCRLALVVLVAKRLNISFVEEGAPVGDLHDVVHLGARGGAALPLAGGVRLEGPGAEGGPGGPVGGVGLEPPGVCRGGPVGVGGAPRCAGGGQARAPRLGASRGRHGRRHGSSVPGGRPHDRWRGPAPVQRDPSHKLLPRARPRIVLSPFFFTIPLLSLSTLYRKKVVVSRRGDFLASFRRFRVH